jgi:phage terminase large subunit GpA-like protein
MTGKGYKTKLHQFVAEEKASNTSREARKTWVNEIAAELWSDEETQPAPPWQPILDGREDYATAEKVTIPKDGLIVTCFTDVQSNRLETEWRAWSREEESWGLGHYIIEGAYNDWETWKAWEKSMQKKWQHESGLAIGLTFGMVDAGKWGDMIANVLRKLTKDAVPGVSGKVRASKGVGEANAVVYRRSGQITPQWKGVHIGTWLAKEIIYDRLSWFGAAEKPSAGFMHFGKCYSDEFVRQLVSEKPEKVRARSGAEILRFKNPDGVRNEALDLVVGNLACFRYRTRWDFETAERQVAEFRQTKVEPAEKDETISLGRAGGWR